MSRDVPANPSENAPLEPRRAPVIPRVRVSADGAALPIEIHVRAIFESGVSRLINLVGPPGSGKTTALNHLAAVLPPSPTVRLIDRPAGDNPDLTVFTSLTPPSRSKALVLTIAPWTHDDLIEYCVARHRERCASIIGRVCFPSASATELEGLPELWQAILEALAENDQLPDLTSALEHALSQLIPDPALRDLAGDACLEAIYKKCDSLLPTSPGLNPLPSKVQRLLRHTSPRNLLAAERLVALLKLGKARKIMIRQLPAELLQSAGRRLRAEPIAISQLRGLADGKERILHPMSASLLLACGADWRPTGKRKTNLIRAHLAGARWGGVVLRGANLRFADLRGADLAQSDCTKIRADGVQLAGADLHEATLTCAALFDANLTRCNLCSISASLCRLIRAELAGAELSHATLEAAQIRHADLTGSRLRGANLRRATLSNTCIEGADFTGAEFTDAIFARMALNVATFTGALFHGATFDACDLSGMRLPGADFRGARLGRSDMTATMMSGADLRETDLRGCGLAEVEWERANLRGADFTNASFHMGSTRSGLVGSAIASEGTRTGFYTDDYFDQDYKPPEEIRKANLCNADVRGAKVAKADWYLVDLRGARYTLDQRDHFRRCGAILHARV